MLARWTINGEPEEHPQEAGQAGRHERPLPTVIECNPGNYCRCDDRADIGSTIEYAWGKRPLLSRNPFGDRLDRGGKISRFTYTQSKPGRRELRRAASECMRGRGQRPNDKKGRVPITYSNSVNHPAGEKKPDRV